MTFMAPTFDDNTLTTAPPKNRNKAIKTKMIVITFSVTTLISLFLYHKLPSQKNDDNQVLLTNNTFKMTQAAKNNILKP